MGSVCQKSPQKQTTMPPNNLSGCPLMSWNIQSTACMQNLCCIGASSQNSSSVSLIRSPRCVPFRTLQTVIASMLMGILKREWAVWPPSSKVAAMPEDATARAIFLVDLTLAKTVFSTKVLPLPPHPSKKNKPPLLEFTASTIAVEAVSWSAFSHCHCCSASNRGTAFCCSS